MADFDAVNNILASHFSTQMASLEPLVTIAWDNAPPITPPDSMADEWCRYSFRPGSETIGALGGITWRGTGVVVVQVFTPLGRGQGPNLDVLRNVQTLFRDSSPISGVRIQPPISIRQFGEQDGWYQGNATIPFESDELL